MPRGFSKHGVPFTVMNRDKLALAAKTRPLRFCAPGCSCGLHDAVMIQRRSRGHLGSKRSAETCARMSAANKGRVLSSARRAAISETTRLSWLDPEKHKSRASAVGLALNKRHEYLDRVGRIYFFRSTWERDFAISMDTASLTWEYESHRLLLSDGRTYVPDFWVQEWGSYVEIKGGSPTFDNGKSAVAQQDGHPVRLIKGRSAFTAGLRLVAEGVMP